MKKKRSKTSTLLFLAGLTALAVVLMFVLNFLEGFKEDSQENKNIEISGDIKEKVFAPNEDIILQGVSVPSKEMIVFWDNWVGLTESDKNGQWVINLGTAFKGVHNFQVITDNSKTSRSTATASIIVGDSKQSLIKSFAAALSRTFSFKVVEKIKLYPRDKK
jgi:hypothetical protein